MVIKGGRLRFGPGDGRLLLYTGRKGVGSRVGHDLTIEVTDWSVEVNISEAAPQETTVAAHVDLRSLIVREGTGGARPLTDDDRREIEGNARRTLDVDRYPVATFESLRFMPDVNDGTISGTLVLHGTAAQLDVRVREVAPGRYRGTTVVTQSAYGIKPYAALMGALKVRDDVDVEIEARLEDPRVLG